ncbi:MAG: hypothetical protein ACI9OE_001810 [Mariniflexile sp.]|jgi:hypothetical protein
MVNGFPYCPKRFCKNHPFELVSIVAIAMANNNISHNIMKPIKENRISKIHFGNTNYQILLILIIFAGFPTTVTLF